MKFHRMTGYWIATCPSDLLQISGNRTQDPKSYVCMKYLGQIYSYTSGFVYNSSDGASCVEILESPHNLLP